MGNEANTLKKALDIMYKRQRWILNDLNDFKLNMDYEDSEQGRIKQAINNEKRNNLITQEKYIDMDIRELLGCD